MSYWSPLPENLGPEYQKLITEMRALKDASCLTYKQIGRLTHYSHASWERWLNGKRPVPRPALLSLIEATHADGAHLRTLFDEAFDHRAARFSPAAAPPCRLPRDPADFAGRDLELRTLVSALAEPGRHTPPVWSIVGTEGVGKTSLAVRAAHRLGAYYPGGSLFLGLHGGATPRTADTALAELLAALGVGEAELPAGTDRRAALLRSRLAGRRVLLVLDDALDAAQVRPLLPGDAGGAAIVTSREPLAGLPAVHQIRLEPLPTLIHGSAAAVTATSPEPSEPSNPSTVSTPSKPVPRLLPSDTRVFTGRDAEVAALSTLIEQGTSGLSGGAATVVVVQGMAGIGKTALAVHVAHRLRDRFPDGQLFLDLHGYTDGLAPVSAQSALDSVLRSLDGSAPVPNGLEERAARLRDLLAGSRTLLVLDNARDADQVRPLIPASSGCAVVVTSRSGLPSLLDAGRVEVGSLPEDQSRALLAAVVGAGRVAADPAGVAKILEHCSGLPLALGIVGARLASRPSWSPAMLSERLDDERRRLDELRVGDLAVRTAFQTGYDSVVEAGSEPSAATAFPLLGLIPGGDVGVATFAAVCGIDAVPAEDLLERLVDARLVDSVGPGRYGLHDLLRLYATELAARGLTAEERRHAVEELVLHYGSTAAAAVELQVPGRRSYYLHELPRRTVSTPFPDVEAAVRWYEAERMNLRALAGLAGASPMVDEVLARLPWILQPFFYFRTRWDDWYAFAHAGLDAAKRLNSSVLQGRCYSALAFLSHEQGLLDDAARWARTGIATAEAAGDAAGRASAQEPLAFVHIGRGEFAAARDLLEQVLAFRTSGGSGFSIASILNNLGNACFLMGDMEAARTHLERGLDACQGTGDLYNESYLRCSLGETHLLVGEYEAALEQLAASIVLMREINDERAEALALDLRGQAHRALGDRDAARRAWEAAEAIMTRLQHRRAESIRAELRRLAVGDEPLDSPARSGAHLTEVPPAGSAVRPKAA